MMDTKHRRKYIRIEPIGMPIKIIYDKKIMFGIVENLGASGCKASSEDSNFNELKSGDIVEIEFVFKENGFKAFGSIIRDNTAPNPTGIKFIFQDSSDKILLNSYILEDYLNSNC